jgi:tetratricopeptide (TPR) repeat protein
MDNFNPKNLNQIEMSHIFELIELLEYEQAAFYLNEMLKLNPNNIEALDTFSEVLVNLGNTAEAILVNEL